MLYNNAYGITTDIDNFVYYGYLKLFDNGSTINGTTVAGNSSSYSDV